MTKTNPKNDSTKQLNEIYHMKRFIGLHSPGTVCEICSNTVNCWGTTVLCRMKQEFFFPYWGLCEHNAEQ